MREPGQQHHESSLMVVWKKVAGIFLSTSHKHFLVYGNRYQAVSKEGTAELGKIQQHID